MQQCTAQRNPLLHTAGQFVRILRDSPSRVGDADEIEQTVLTYFAEADGSTATRQKAIRAALARLRLEGLIEEESEGRYTVSPMVEIVLSAERLAELVACKPRRLIVLRNHAPHVEFIVSAGRGMEVQP